MPKGVRVKAWRDCLQGEPLINWAPPTYPPLFYNPYSLLPQSAEPEERGYRFRRFLYHRPGCSALANPLCSLYDGHPSCHECRGIRYGIGNRELPCGVCDARLDHCDGQCPGD